MMQTGHIPRVGHGMDIIAETLALSMALGLSKRLKPRTRGGGFR